MTEAIRYGRPHITETLIYSSTRTSLSIGIQSSRNRFSHRVGSPTSLHALTRPFVAHAFAATMQRPHTKCGPSDWAHLDTSGKAGVPKAIEGLAEVPDPFSLYPASFPSPGNIQMELVSKSAVRPSPIATTSAAPEECSTSEGGGEPYPGHRLSTPQLCKMQSAGLNIQWTVSTEP